MEEMILKNMAHVTYGIYVLTTRFEESINGMIASWVSQVSYEPPYSWWPSTQTATRMNW